MGSMDIFYDVKSRMAFMLHKSAQSQRLDIHVVQLSNLNFYWVLVQKTRRRVNGGQLFR